MNIRVKLFYQTEQDKEDIIQELIQQKLAWEEEQKRLKLELAIALLAQCSLEIENSDLRSMYREQA